MCKIINIFNRIIKFNGDYNKKNETYYVKNRS